jgi:hypothetical protein
MHDVSTASAARTQDARDKSVTDQRLQVRVNGYSPIPIKGKIPHYRNWQNQLYASPEQIKLWARLHWDHTNTGLLCAYTPAFDLDVLNAVAVRDLVDCVREIFGDRGIILTRIGKAPKCLIPFRTETFFKKKVAPLIAVSGDEDKIEVLAHGQQFAAFGDHPGTGRPYAWHGGSPLTVRHADLPCVTEDEVRAALEQLISVVEGHGYIPAKKAKASRGNARFYQAGESACRAELEENIRDGYCLHESLCSLSSKLRASGASEGEAIAALQALMHQSAAKNADRSRWQERFYDIHRLCRSAAKFKREEPPPINGPEDYGWRVVS